MKQSITYLSSLNFWYFHNSLFVTGHIDKRTAPVTRSK